MDETDNSEQKHNLWSHFVKNKKSFKTASCNYCGRTLSYRTTVTNLKIHLKLKHEQAYTELMKHCKVRTKTEGSEDANIDETMPSRKTNTTGRKNIPLWKHFIKDSATKTAECNYCGNTLSYRTTITNLKTHLKYKHKRAFEELLTQYEEQTFCNENETSSDDDATEYTERQHSVSDISDRRQRQTAIWNHFDRDPATRMAECNYCGKCLSYKTTITNLKVHLKSKHEHAFAELTNQSENETVSSELSIKLEEATEIAESESGGDEETDGVPKLSDVWSYFETGPKKRANCVVCRTVVGSNYDELKSHLKNHHPKLLLQILQDKESDAASNDGDADNIYTEVVYLEQEEDTLKIKEKPKPSPKIIPKSIKRRKSHFYDEDYEPERKQRVNVPAHTSAHIPAKSDDTDSDSDELSAFLKYITCLLKKLPKEVFSQVQVDIINTILKANTSVNTVNAVVNDNQPTQHIILESDVQKVSNAVTVSEILPQANYTITVAQTKPEEIEISTS